MKKIEKLLKGHKHICFLDFEGTQFSHEMIAIGAVMTSLDKNGRIKKMKEPFKILVKAHNKIGKYVVQLTGITEDMLVKEGVSFAHAMEALKKYCGLNFKKASFITYGNHDMRILSQSIAYNLDFPKEICSNIQKNYIDYAVFIQEFVRDDNGNPLSLIHNCERFSVKEAGRAHDPDIDAINLANLYDAFLANPELVKNEYMHAVVKTNHFPDPIKQVVNKLMAGETVTKDNFEEFVKEYLR